MDDLWGESDGDDCEKRLREKEYKRLQAQYATVMLWGVVNFKTGYREGASEAKENSLQLGFNKGFKLGSESGSKFGRLVGVIR